MPMIECLNIKVIKQENKRWIKKQLKFSEYFYKC